MASESSNIIDQGIVNCSRDQIQCLKQLALGHDHPLDVSGSITEKDYFNRCLLKSMLNKPKEQPLA